MATIAIAEGNPESGGFLSNETGTYYVRSSNRDGRPDLVKIAQQEVHVLGHLYDPQDNESWHAVIAFVDKANTRRELRISLKDLYRDQTGVIARAAGKGLFVCGSSAAKGLFVDLLTSTLTEAPLPVVNRFGFFGNTGVFVLPGNTIVPDWYKGVVPQVNAELSQLRNVIRDKGSFDAWKERMGSAGTVLNKFLLCFGLSNVFIDVLNVEPMGLHVYGASSSGKTNALRAVASIWGVSALSGTVYAGKWGVTPNAIELLCHARSGLILLLDEIRQFKGPFEAVAYMILDGVGKVRMDGNLQQAETKSWVLNLLSTGELSTTSMTKKTDGDVFTGAQIRLLDFPIEGFISRSDFTLSSEEADSFRRSLGDDYGFAGPEFIKRLLANFNSYEEFVSEMQEWFYEALDELKGHFPEGNAVQRVLPRFALIYMTGVLAVKFEILPFTEDEVEEAVLIAIEVWLEAFEARSDVELAAQELRQAVIMNGHRLYPVDDQDIVANQPPLAFTDDHYIYLSDEHIQEITDRVSPTQLGKHLKALGCLHTNDSRNKIKKKLPGLAILRVFAVNKSFFGDLGSIDATEASITAEAQANDELGEDALKAFSEELDPNIQF
ncbi:DUF927 domain-containing protein [Amphritea sp.]|uniref:DUF927 domain-containing protein n=1 Tax=Amphritea sp. TaxID=1872502 RepID=UPI003A939B24